MAGILCCMVLWQAWKKYSDSDDAAGMSVSRARGALDKLHGSSEACVHVHSRE